MADRYLLESGTPDGYQLEDGSGVYLLNGHPITWTTGYPDKSQYVTTSGGDLTATVNADVSAPCGVRATGPASGKKRVEHLISGHGTDANGSCLVGVTDGGLVLGPLVFPYPGNGTNPGACFRLKNGTTNNDVARNGTIVTGTALTSALADADRLAIEFDDTAATVTLFHKSGAGAWYQVQQITLTSNIPASGCWFAYFGGFGNGDGVTTAFSALNGTPSTGYSAYDAASSTYSLTAAVGAYSLTGTATGLTAARRLTLSVGSYALTGTATGLKKGFNLPAAVGSYSLTGTATSLRLARRQVEAVGSYTISGTATGLKVARRLSAAVGSYILTGTAANLVYTPATKVLSAAVGSYALTGTAATLRAARRLAASVGVYSITGSSSGLIASRRLAIVPGAYSITGVSSVRVIQRRLVLSVGAYVLIGLGVSLTAARKVAANSGTYALTGTPVGLGAGRRLTAASGAYALLGGASSLVIGRRLAADSGIYLLTGPDVVLSHFQPAPVPPSRTTVADARLGETSATGKRTTIADPVRSTRADAGRTTYASKRAA